MQNVIVTATHYWLGRSALDDIKCAVMDQASLINLAELLNQDGDLERSFRYIRFTWQCNSFFNTRMRASQIQSVLNVIEKNYQDASNRNKLLLLRRLEAHCSPYCRLSCSFA